jgi:hypothetical protein
MKGEAAVIEGEAAVMKGEAAVIKGEAGLSTIHWPRFARDHRELVITASS